jgi:RIO kinase 1
VHEGTAYIFDVSQSVEQDHPHAFDFLRHDIQNLIHYFRKYEIAVISARASFAYITGAELRFRSGDAKVAEGESERGWLEDEEETAYLRALADAEAGEVDAEDEKVFKNMYIPQNLNDIEDPEVDALKGEESAARGMLYSQEERNLAAMKDELAELELDTGDSDTDTDSDSDMDVCSNSSFEEFLETEGYAVPSRVRTAEEKADERTQKKANKRAVKEANRERRKTKVPKAEKRKALKSTTRKKK